MQKFQVTCLELVYVERTYNVEAEDRAGAEEAARYGDGDLVEEMIGESHQFCSVQAIHDMNGNEVV